MSIIPKEVFERWENALCENLVLATSKKFYCPFKDCSAMLVNNDGNEVVTCSECPHYHRLFCAQCKVAWHGGLECVDAWISAGSWGSSSLTLLNGLQKLQDWFKLVQIVAKLVGDGDSGSAEEIR
ncbi:hypothetical protein S245_039327 [Arachis hypogaea]|nr:uncharacterized protein DS421_12g357780 [Arachis hypogaea]